MIRVTEHTESRSVGCRRKRVVDGGEQLRVAVGARAQRCVDRIGLTRPRVWHPLSLPHVLGYVRSGHPGDAGDIRGSEPSHARMGQSCRTVTQTRVTSVTTPRAARSGGLPAITCTAWRPWPDRHGTSAQTATARPHITGAGRFSTSTLRDQQLLPHRLLRHLFSSLSLNRSRQAWEPSCGAFGSHVVRSQPTYATMCRTGSLGGCWHRASNRSVIPACQLNGTCKDRRADPTS